jgi:hypothetical protein
MSATENTHESNESRGQSALGQLDDDNSEYMWISLGKKTSPIHRELKDYEQSYLRCPICHDFFKNAVYVKACHHTFCSECVRRAFKNGLASMRRKQDCPTCKVEIKDENAELIPDYGLQRCVNQFQTFRGLLKNALDESSCTNGSATASSITMDTRMNKRTRSNNNDDMKSMEGTMNPPVFQTQPSSSTVVKTTTYHTSCPPQRKPTPHYHGLKKKQLETLCRDAGLLANGSEEELIERHRNYIILWNAECDSETPKSEAEIVREVNHREALRKKEGMKQNFISTKGPNGKDGFKALIDQVRIRKEATSNVTSKDAMDKDPGKAFSNSNSIDAKKPAITIIDMYSTETFNDGAVKKEDEPRSETETNSNLKSLLKEKEENGAYQPVHESVAQSSTKTTPSTALSKNPYSTRRLSSGESIIGPWTCSRCTFLNQSRTWKNADCAMCSFPRPSNEA